jgi:4-diphosphocytidyl-2C-methyl-D-erythritol kinase
MKNIPVAAGLAGDSDANSLRKQIDCELGLSMDELAEIGAEIGSDVSFVYMEVRHWPEARGKNHASSCTAKMLGHLGQTDNWCFDC